MRTLETGLGQGRSYAVYGGPSTGKTSVLRQLVHRARVQLTHPARGTRQVPVYIDLAACAAGRPHALAAAIWDAVSEAVLDPRVQAHPQPPRLEPLALMRAPRPWEMLWTGLETLWERLANTPGWCRALWLFDNAEHLHPGAWDDADAQLAGASGGPEPWRPQGMAFAGGPAWQAHVQRFRSPWRLRPQLLGPLREAEVAQLLRTGGLDHDALAPLVAASGKHPQVLQCLLSAYQRHAGDTTAVLDAARPILERTFARLLGGFAPYRNRRGDVALEHLLLQHLLERGEDAPLAQVEQALQRGPVKAACDLLEQSAVLERLVRGNLTLLRAGCALWNSYYLACVPALSRG